MKRLLSLVLLAACAAVLFPLGCGPTCSAHEDCEANEVCVFSSGHCSPKCSAEDASACGSSMTCDTCATSSCPTCRDCLAACISPSGGGGPGGW